MINYIKYLLTEIAFFWKTLKEKAQGKAPHKYARMYVMTPIFGGQYLKKETQDGKEVFVFKSGHQEAEMFSRKQCNIYIKIYKKAGKHHTRFAIVKKRVVTLLEEIKRAEEEQQQEAQAESWSKKQKNTILPITTKEIMPKTAKRGGHPTKEETRKP